MDNECKHEAFVLNVCVKCSKNTHDIIRENESQLTSLTEDHLQHCQAMQTDKDNLKGIIAELDSELEEANQEIASLQQDDWIDVNERLPEENAYNLLTFVSYKGGDGYYQLATFYKGKFSSALCNGQEVLVWKQLEDYPTQ